MTWRDRLLPLRRRWWLAAGLILAAAAAGWATGGDDDGEGPHVATLRLYEPSDTPVARSSVGLTLTAVAQRSTEGPLPERVADRLDRDARVVRDATTISVEEDTQALTIATRSDAADTAALTTEAWATAILEDLARHRERRNAERLASALDRLDRLDGQLTELAETIAQSADDEAARLAATFEADRLSDARERVGEQVDALNAEDLDVPVLEAGTLRVDPVTWPLGTDEPWERAAVAAALALLPAVLAALLVDRLTGRVHGRSDAVRATGLPTVGLIPRVRRRVEDFEVLADSRPDSAFTDALHHLRLAVQLTLRAAEPPATEVNLGDLRTLVVTGAAPGSGTTTTVTNLAVAYAAVGKSVLVIDVNFPAPQQHLYFNVEREPGAAEFLVDGARRPPLAAFSQPTVISGVEVVPCGGTLAVTTQPSTLDLLESARALADVVLLDTAPLLSASDPSALIADADGVLLCLRSGGTSRRAARRAAERLRALQAPVIGTVLTAVPRASRVRTADGALPDPPQLLVPPGPAPLGRRSAPRT